MVVKECNVWLAPMYIYIGYRCIATHYIIVGPGSRPDIPYCLNIGMKLIYITDAPILWI